MSDRADHGDRVEAYDLDRDEVMVRGTVEQVTTTWGRRTYSIRAEPGEPCLDYVDAGELVTVAERADREIRLLCERCGGRRPPGASICPTCEDRQAAYAPHQAPATPPPGFAPPREPPHGNTTR